MLNRIAIRWPPWQRESAQREPWQRVPKVNLLARPTRRIPIEVISLLAFGVIAVILLLVAYSAYQGMGDANDLVDARTTTLSQLRRDLINQQTLLDELQESIGLKKFELEEASRPSNVVETARLDWQRAFTTLFGIEASRIVVNSAETGDEGTLTLRGTADEVIDMERYQSEIRARADTLQLISLTWNLIEVAGTDDSPPSTFISFTANLKVLRGADDG